MFNALVILVVWNEGRKAPDSSRDLHSAFFNSYTSNIFALESKKVVGSQRGNSFDYRSDSSFFAYAIGSGLSFARHDGCQERVADSPMCEFAIPSASFYIQIRVETQRSMFDKT
jgi:hypothetical protein